jgi:hypothetical protein
MLFGGTMRNAKIVLCMAALAVCLLIGVTFGQGWLGGGYAGGYDRSMMFEPGTSEMVRWLDAPVPYYPWYSPGLTIGSIYSGSRGPGLTIGSTYRWSTPYYSYYYPYKLDYPNYMPYNY